MKLKLSIPLFIAVMCSFAAATAFGQANDSKYFIPNLFPKSPNASEFSKYGDYKVNLFTGLPDISIPLYTIQSGSLEVPVTLSYHASGVKVAQVATWAGLGWSISAGSVTRSIQGLPDDQAGGLFLGSFRSGVGTTTDADVHYLQSVIDGSIDTRPDIFSYDFPGHSGKFFFDPTNGLQPALIPFAPVVVSRVSSSYNIVDEHGTNYLFNTQETTTTTVPGHSSSATTSWMLGSMMSQDKKDTILLNYSPQTVWEPQQTSNTDILYTDVYSSGAPCSGYTSQYLPRNSSTTDVAVNEQDLSTIYFKNGEVIFDLDASARTDLAHPPSGLKDIKIMAYNAGTKAYQLQKQIVFFKTYFTNSTQPRLRLDSIQIQDAAGAIIQHYRFDYNTSITMPVYDSPGIDYWGYYNGKDISDNRVPNQTFQYSANASSGTLSTANIGSTTTFNNRDPDSTKMQACVLTGIHYPTGGYSTFTYQTNRYLNDASVLTLAGGLRVSSIQSYDGINPTPIVHTYQYNLAAAKANFTLDYGYFAYSQKHESWAIGSNLICGTAYANYYVSNPRFDLDPYDGAPVVYPFVTEFIGTPGANIGRTDYYYRFVGDGIQHATSTGTPIVASAFYQRGQLLGKREYMRKSDGTYQLVRRDTSSYTAFATNQHYNVGLNVGKNIVNDGSMGGPFLASAGGIFSPDPNIYNGFIIGYYSIPSDDNFLTGTTSYVYDTTNPSNYTTSTVTYNYDNITHLQVNRTYHTDSKGNMHITTNKYPADYLSSGGTSTNNSILDAMLTNNMQAEVIEKWDSIKNVPASISAVTGGQFTQFKTGNFPATIVPAKISVLNTIAPLNGFVPSHVTTGGTLVGDANYTQMISLDAYDSRNNIIQYTPRNATPVSILWDNYWAEPVAQVKNSVNGNIAYTSFEADSKGNWSYSGTPVNDPTAPSGSMIYPLSSGTISTAASISAAKNYVVSYWSNSGPATVNSTTGSALRINGGWTYYEHLLSGTSTVSVSGTNSIDELRLYPSDAQMNTYVYTTGEQISTIDTKGQFSYFEYDPFQRLKNIKDWNGNIVKNYYYHTYDQGVGNDYQSASISRNNCPTGMSSTSTTTFSVAANKYFSSSKVSANAEAMYDVQTNGQIKANMVCGCGTTPATITFTLTNTTGVDYWVAFYGTSGSPQYIEFPPLGPASFSIGADTYSISVYPNSGNAPYFITLGSRTTNPASPRANFTGVVINTGSTDVSLSIH